MRIVAIALAFLGVGMAVVPPASAAIVDEILELYDPDLVVAKSAVQCVLEGGGINACTVKAGQQKLEGNGDFQNIMAVAEAVKDKNYPVLLEKAGLAAACAWIAFPGKDLACSELGGAVIDAGKQIAAAGVSIVKNATEAVAEVAASGAKAVVCLFSGCSSSGSGLTVTVDGAALWKNCYQNTLPASLRARLGGAETWLERIDTSLIGARFKPGSLAATCSNDTLTGFAASEFFKAPEIQAAIAGQMRAVHVTMMAKYKTVVEDAAGKTMIPTAAKYTSLQNTQFDKATTAAASLFTQSGSLNLALTAELNGCLKSLSTPEATSLSRWSEGANATNIASAVPGLTASGWSTSYAPQPWCANTYISAVQKDIVRRRDLRDKAVAAGCTINARDPRHFTCPAVGSGASFCQQAFQGATDFTCDRPAIRLSPTPAKPAATPPPANRPATTTQPATSTSPSAVTKPMVPLVPRTTLPPAATQTPPAPNVEAPKTGIVRPNCYP